MSHPSGSEAVSQSDLESSDAQSLASDPEAMVRAMEDCRPSLLHVANREIGPVLRPKEGASDIVQETFLEAHRDREQFSGRSHRELKSWLMRILRNNLANFVRRYSGSIKRQVGREVSLDRDRPGGQVKDKLAAPSVSPASQAILSEQAARLEEALHALPERERLVLIWRNHDYCHWDEIGRRLGGTPGMAQKIWYRAVDRLRAQVGDEPESPADSVA